MFDLDNNFEQAMALYNKGLELKQKKKYSEALKCFNDAILMRSQFAGAFFEIGNILIIQNKPLEASSQFWSAALFMNLKAEAVLMTGRALYFAKHFLSAKQVFQLVDIDKFDELSLLMYIDSLREENDIYKAYNLSHKIKQRNTLEFLRILADLHISLGEIEKAKQILEKLVDHKNNNTCFIHNRLIYVYTALKEYDKLFKMLNNSKNSCNSDTFSYYTLATLNRIILNKHEDIKPANNKHYCIYESVLYLEPYKESIEFTGNSYQTFEVVQNKIPNRGLLLEFGVRNGHTITKIANMFPNRKVFGFDSFEGIPEAWNNEKAGSYSVAGRLPEVPSNVELVIGWFNETLPGFKKEHNEPVAFMNIDCDIYSSTKTIFDELDKQIIAGTIITFDEYIANPSWKEDEFKAFQEWVKANNVEYKYLTASFVTKQVTVEILSRY